MRKRSLLLVGPLMIMAGVAILVANGAINADEAAVVVAAGQSTTELGLLAQILIGAGIFTTIIFAAAVII